MVFLKRTRRITMNSLTLTLSPEQVSALEAKYPSNVQPPPPHAVLRLKIDGLTITAYQSGKVLFQGKGIETFIQKNQLESSIKTSKEKSKDTPSLPKDFSSWSVMGSDEVGNGAYFGPLTVASAYVSKEHLPLLKKMGVRDSKDLTDEQIRALVPKIKEVIPYKLLTLWPQKYNEVQQVKNLNEMKALLHNQALRLLSEKIMPESPEGYLIDQFCKPELYYRYLKGQPLVDKNKTYFITKGESHHIAVAAASMIARCAFLDGLDSLSAEYGYKLPSGAGSNVDQIAAKILKHNGMDTLRKVAKLHFANTEKAKRMK